MRQYNAARMTRMIPRSKTPDAPAAQRQAGVIRHRKQLMEHARARGADPKAIRTLDSAATDFPLRVPVALLDQVQDWGADDPVLRQVLPTALERQNVAGYVDDPVGEAQRQDGALLQKYAGRALLITTQACDVHCRYCFRRNFDYAAAQAPGNYDAEFAALAADDSIRELILSGGDPLTLSTRRFSAIVRAAEHIPHLRTLRVHTRSAIVHPARVTRPLLDTLAQSRLRVVVVVHANTAQEIGATAEQALQALANSGAMLLNQAVLLAGVNETVEAQIALSNRLFDCGVLPYYLHQLDPVAGAAHFQVSDAQAQVMLDALRARVPGYLVPKLVREIAGAPAKTPI